MADNNILDMIGGGYLKRLAGGDGTKPDTTYVPANADAAKRNQDYADKQLKKAPAAPASTSPLSTTMTPVVKAKGKQ